MTVDVTSEIVIHRPRSEVACYSSDPDNAPAWYVNITGVEWRTPPPLAVGSHIAFVAQFLGRRMAYTYEIIVLVPGERLVMRTAQGPFPMETSYTWETTADGGTRMTLRNRGTPAGFSRLVAPFMAHAVRRANRKDLAALKRLLETRGSLAGPGWAAGGRVRPCLMLLIRVVRVGGSVSGDGWQHVARRYPAGRTVTNPGRHIAGHGVLVAGATRLQ
jgi:uncharacterized protein YndB with AHSA1/START domain